MAVIEFINGENKTYGAMKEVLEYITNPAYVGLENGEFEKTIPLLVEY